MKEVLRSLDLGLLPQIGLLAFVLAFVAIVVYVFSLSRGTVRELSDLPFDETVPADPPPGDAPGPGAPPAP